MTQTVHKCFDIINKWKKQNKQKQGVLAMRSYLLTEHETVLLTEHSWAVANICPERCSIVPEALL